MATVVGVSCCGGVAVLACMCSNNICHPPCVGIVTVAVMDVMPAVQMSEKLVGGLV